jgi:hypothetical protein
MLQFCDFIKSFFNIADPFNISGITPRQESRNNPQLLLIPEQSREFRDGILDAQLDLLNAVQFRSFRFNYQ